MRDKSIFLKTVTIYHDTREQKNEHILSALDNLKIKHEPKKLDIGDYSFGVGARDFTLSCAIERKADPDELYTNIMEGAAGHKGERIEKEFASAKAILNDFTVLIENVGSVEELKAYKVPDWKMKASPQRVVSEIGKEVYTRICSWQTGNRYGFRVEFSKDPAQTAAKMLERFYYYHQNYTKAIAPRR